MICIYLKSISPRIQYVFHWIFKSTFNQDYTFTTDSSEFENHPASIKINCTGQKINDSFSIELSPILFEEGITEMVPQWSQWDNLSVLFPSNNPNNSIPFDIFSACFYLLSRYEEYNTSSLDIHERFPATESTLHSQNVLHVPIVDLWLKKFASVLSSAFGTTIQMPQYNEVLTIDVDMVYKYKGRSIVRTIGGFTRDILSGRIKELNNRFFSLAGMREDPYFIFKEWEKWMKEYDKVCLFIHCGDYGPYDKQVGLYSQDFVDFLKASKQELQIGIHPSYKSNLDSSLILKEKSRLENIIEGSITDSRQHFLKLSIPSTYQNLIKAGINTDYSMGFADHCGFRAGTSRKFPFFDLSSNSSTELQLQPFCAMDVTLKNYMGLNPESAAVELVKLKEIIKETGGTFVIIAHNESLSEDENWLGWKNVILQN
jgi:hypothetical protein